MTKIAIPVIVSIVGLTAVAAVGGILLWGGINLTVEVSKVAGILAPVAFAAAVVERGVEIMISPWRDSQADALQQKIDAIKARPANSADSAQDKKDLADATQALSDYRGETQRLAFVAGFIISALLSIAGVRALEEFLPANGLTAVHEAQRRMFIGVDVGVTALLLAGGADGVHSIVNAVTSFFDASADKASKSNSDRKTQ